LFSDAEPTEAEILAETLAAMLSREYAIFLSGIVVGDPNHPTGMRKVPPSLFIIFILTFR
jgi:hypothetical protein